MVTENFTINLDIAYEDIIKLIKNNMDFIEKHKEVREQSRELNNIEGNTESEILRALNIIFKYPKKKNLFTHKSRDDSDREIKLGCNTSGLGIAHSYETNLSNIERDYYAKQTLKEQIKKDTNNFNEALIIATPKRYKEDIKKLLKIFQELTKDSVDGDGDDKTKYDINENVGVLIEGSGIDYYIHSDVNDKFHYADRVTKIDEDDIREDKNNNKYVNVEFNQIRDYNNLMGFKTDIITFLDTKLIEINKKLTEKQNKIKFVEDFLNPFDALNNI